MSSLAPLRALLACVALLFLAGCAGTAAESAGGGGVRARVDRARIHSLQGYGLLMEGRVDSALATFRRAAAEARKERTPGESGRWGLALAYQLSGRQAESDSLVLTLPQATQPESFLAQGWFAELAADSFSALARYRKARAVDSTYTPPYLREARLHSRRGELRLADSLLAQAAALGDTLAATWRAELIPPPPLSPEDSLIAAAESSSALTRLQWVALLKRYRPVRREDRFAPPRLIHFRAARDSSLSELEGTPWVGLAQAALSEDHIELYPDGTFRAADTVSRANFALWLDRISPDTVAVNWVPLVDVPTTDFRWGAVQRALTRGLLKPPAPGRFEPDAAITGAETVTALRQLRQGS